MYFRCRKSFLWKFKQTYLIAVGIWTSESCFGLFIWWISWWKCSVVQFKYSSADLSDKGKSIVFSLAGYVFLHFLADWDSPKKIIRIAQKYCNNILAAGKLGDEKQELPEHKLVNTKNWRVLWKVTAEAFWNFLYSWANI